MDEPEVARPSFQPDGMYYAVKQVLKGAVNGFPLNKRFKDKSTPDLGFLQPGDERWGRNFNQFKLSKARIVSCSFDSSTGTCRTCLSGEHAAWEGADGGPVVVVLSDQHFPANVPADGPGECLRIIRVENGTLNEMTDELIRKAPSKGLPAGSVILLLSTSQLYYESVEHYAAEWSRCRNWLRADLGEVLVLPGLPLTGSGIYSKSAVRGLLDFYARIGRLEEPELKLIRNTRLAWADAYLGKTERGGGWADTRINIRLPVSLREGAGRGWGQRPKAITALNDAGERHWLLKLVGEMNRELRLCLATEVSVGRTLSAVRRQERSVQMGRVATLGASNAANIAAALGEAGMEVVTFGKVGWRVTADKIEAMEEEISLECKDTDVLLLHCLDNQVFYVMDEETGGMAFPAKGKDDRYHAKGKVTVAKGPATGEPTGENGAPAKMGPG